jgi:hypothetical protein
MMTAISCEWRSDVMYCGVQFIVVSRGFGDVELDSKIKASVPLGCKVLSAHCYLRQARFLAVWLDSHSISFSTP